MPAWARSVRFRLALLYSVLLVTVGALVVGAVYWGLARSVSGEPVTRDLLITSVSQGRGGLTLQQRTVRAEYVSVEQLVNERTLDEMRRFSLFAIGGLFPMSLLIGWFVAGRALRPIGEIGAVAREIQATDLSRRIGLNGPPDEILRLADTFDDMLDRIEEGVDEQRRFVEDTSHELRNPLAVMATTLDVALADPDAGAGDLRRAAEVVRRTVDRTARRVDELVAYARREVPAERRVPVDLGRLVAEAADEFAAPAAARSLRLATAARPARVLGDRDSLKIALGNLVDNAVRLAPVGSTITVGSGQDEDWAWLAVADEGPGIPADEHELVFRRSWRGTGEPGTGGLGLAIVRQVAGAHDGLVTLRSAAGLGSTFAIWLPARAGADPEAVTADGLHPQRDPLR